MTSFPDPRQTHFDSAQVGGIIILASLIFFWPAVFVGIGFAIASGVLCCCCKPPSDGGGGPPTADLADV